MASAIGAALDQQAWRDAGSPVRQAKTCPHCGQQWVEEVTTRPGPGRDDDPVKYYRVVEGEACECARIRKQAEDDARRAARRAEQKAREEFAASLPELTGEESGTWRTLSGYASARDIREETSRSLRVDLAAGVIYSEVGDKRAHRVAD